MEGAEGIDGVEVLESGSAEHFDPFDSFARDCEHFPGFVTITGFTLGGIGPL